MSNAKETFTKKLEAFSSTLTDHERAAFKTMLEQRNLSDKQLEQVQGGQSKIAAAPQLNANFFSRFMLSW